MVRAEQLAERFAQLARWWHAAPTPAEARRRVARSAVDSVAGCEHAAITLITRHASTVSVAATDDTAELVDRIQQELGRGPCLDAMRTRAWCLIPDFTTDESSPAFSRPATAQTGVRSMLSLPLFFDDEMLGALNLYSSAPDAFSGSAIATASVLAAHAALAIADAGNRERCAELEEALISNRVIGMAVGIVMAGRRATPEQALELLRGASRRSNRKLSDIAAEVVETGQDPTAVPVSRRHRSALS